jgi:hypothetical protein
MPSNGSASPHLRRSLPTVDPTPADVNDFLRSIPIPLRLPEHDEILNRVTTPYNADTFEHMLDKHDLTARYPNLVRNLRNGFPMGDFPDLEQTIISPIIHLSRNTALSCKTILTRRSSPAG